MAGLTVLLAQIFTCNITHSQEANIYNSLSSTMRTKNIHDDDETSEPVSKYYDLLIFLMHQDLSPI